MAITVETLDPRQELETCLSVLNRNRERAVGRERFEWLYLDNPAGVARVWVARESTSGNAVAFTSALPREVRVEGKEVHCWNCCDFSVDKRYRTLGVAIKLRKKAKEGVLGAEVDALYAHPNDRMKVVHEKVGHRRLGTMRRYAKPLRAEEYVTRAVKNPFLAASLGFVGTLALRAVEKPVRLPRGMTVVSVGDLPFGDEYDELYARAADWTSILGDRGAAYLTWRYHASPLYRTRRLELRSHGRLEGYLVYCDEGGVFVFKDALCPKNSSAAAGLVRAWIRLARRAGARSLSAILMESNTLVEDFFGAGFRSRPETSSVYVYAGETGELASTWENGNNWFMTVGDRDV